MKIQFRETPKKIAVEIDPTLGRNNRFCPLVAAVEFKDAPSIEKGPHVITTFSGYMTNAEAAQYAEAMHLAAFISELARQGESLKSIYSTMQRSGLPNMKSLYDLANEYNPNEILTSLSKSPGAAPLH